MKRRAALAGLAALPFAADAADALPLFDAHIHYSHDAWSLVPPAQAIAILRGAGLRGAFLSSSNDDGQQRLLAEAPDLIVPALRPYRLRSDVGSWMRDDGVLRYVEQRLAKYRYVGLGEFHLYGADADLTIPKRMIELARLHKLVLHAHSDVDAIERLFRQWPEARILWAHSGFERPDAVRALLRRYPRLHADLAYRSDQGAGGKADATFTRSPKSEWDIASGAALIKEAGGTMTDIHGNQIRFNQRHVKVAGMIADNTILHHEMVKIAPHPDRAP
ncbi:MAG: hypothetical protein HY021_14490, partial [Burkholderiales bacterium]|nr:hypothetical protein [Burkholderiales bacterium]